MVPALFFAYRRVERLYVYLRPSLKTWQRWEFEAASQTFQRDIDPMTGRPVPPRRELGDCYNED